MSLKISLPHICLFFLRIWIGLHYWQRRSNPHLCRPSKAVKMLVTLTMNSPQRHRYWLHLVSQGFWQSASRRCLQTLTTSLTGVNPDPHKPCSHMRNTEPTEQLPLCWTHWKRNWFPSMLLLCHLKDWQ